MINNQTETTDHSTSPPCCRELLGEGGAARLLAAYSKVPHRISTRNLLVLLAEDARNKGLSSGR